MQTTTRLLLLAGIATGGAVLIGCTTTPPMVSDAEFQQMMMSSFTDKGIATVDRLKQDPTDAACSEAQGAALAPEKERALQAQNLATVKLPADGQYLGDWKAGEKLAQNGRGMTWRDTSTAPSANGGSCYNCHQISASEISYGTIGPSLYHYGKNRGVTDPKAPGSKAIVDYTWVKLYNAKAYNACSAMPRFGHAGLLDEAQLKDLMALLLDPSSPVNQ